MDPKIQEMFDRLGITLPTLDKNLEKLSDSTKNAVKSATAQALLQAKAHADLLKSINEQLIASGKKTAATKQELELIARQIKIEEEQYEQAQESLARQKDLDKKREEGIRNLISNVKNLGSSALGATTALYNSDKAFSSTIPTLELMGSAVKTVVEAAGLAMSGIEAFGFSLGKASEGLSKLAIASVDVTIAVAKMQLEMSQTYLDTYNKLSSAGVTFAGNLTGLAKTAADGGLDLQAYGEFVKKNIESLSALGGTVESAAGRVMKMGKAALEGRDDLLVMYGGFKEVDDALAGWSKILASSGLDMTKNQSALQAASANYLTSLKDLQQLTGQSVEQLQKEQEEAQKDIAFRMKLSELEAQGPEGIKKAQALRDQETLTLRLYGKQAADLYKEKVALDGRVISQSGLTYQAFNRAQDQATNGMIAAAKTDQKERLKATAAVVEQSKGAIKAQTQSMKGVYQQGQYVGDELTKSLTEGVAQQFDTEAARNSFGEAVADLLKNSDKMSADETKKRVADLYRAQQAGKQKLDQITETNLKDMAKVATQLTNMQVKLIDLFGDKLTSAVDKAILALTRLAGGESGASAPTAPGGTAPEPVAGGRTGAQKRAGASMASILGAMRAPSQRVQAAAADQATAAGLRMKGTEATGGGMANEKLLNLASTIQAQFGDDLKYFSAFNDQYHLGLDRNSAHTKGTALDFVINNPKNAADISSKVKGLPGVKNVINEYANISKDGTGGHIHAEIEEKLAKGGITKGPSLAGEAGPEAVVPLPDGRTIPVQMDNTAVIDKLDELLRVMKDQHDTSERILYAQS